MKTKKAKYSLLLLAAMVSFITVKGQGSNQGTKSGRSDSYEVTRQSSGKVKESVKTSDNGKELRFDFINGKLADLYVDGVKIPAGKYPEYEGEITRIKDQIRKDKVLAEKDQVRAKNDQRQAINDGEQAVKVQANAQADVNRAIAVKKIAEKEEVQAKIDQKKAMKVQVDAQTNREQAIQNKVAAEKAEVMANADQQQAIKNQAEAEVNQQQAQKADVQAKVVKKQMEDDQGLLKNLFNDLINDGMIKDEKDLSSLTLNSSEMIVNSVKQPDSVFNLYKEKYKKFSSGNFTYHNEPNGSKGIGMNRQNR